MDVWLRCQLNNDGGIMYKEDILFKTKHIQKDMKYLHSNNYKQLIELEGTINSFENCLEKLKEQKEQ